MSRSRCLLHICCAPDATVPWEELSRDYEVLGYFYGSNIYPYEEYGRRREAVATLAEHREGGVLFPVWAPQEWLEKTRTYAREPEKGKRCSLCFYLQLSHAAAAARREGCSLLCTTLTISPHKNVERIRAIGEAVACRYGLEWLHKVWRKGGGFQRSVAQSRELGLYRQNYCGCLYSIHGENHSQHKERGRYITGSEKGYAEKIYSS